MVHESRHSATSSADGDARRTTAPSHAERAGRCGLGRLNVLGGGFLEPCVWSVWFEDRKEKRPR